jgi:hypothetical protein
MNKLDSRFAPTDQFNALSEEGKKEALSGGLGAGLLHSGLSFAVPLWWIFKSKEEGLQLRNGSAFLVDFGQGIFAVTAAHVFTEYLEAKESAEEIGCQLGNVLFEPERRVIGCRQDLDVATFRVSPPEADQINKSTVKPDPPRWEPLMPAAKNFAFFAGFPAQTRGMSPTGNFFATAPYFAMPPITGVTDRQITCRFEREKMLDLGGSGLPSPGYDIGGVSGGPMLMPTLVKGGVIWRFAGVIIEAAAGTLFEQVVTVRAHYIHPDGRIG